MKKNALLILLQYDKAQAYCLEYLKDGNALAQQILKILSFKKGDFFAFTAQSANTKKIYQFQSGGILPQNPLEIMTFNEGEYPARKQANSVEELSQYLCELFRNSPKSSCVFEDVIQIKSDPHITNDEAEIAYLGNEVYYYLSGKDFSFEKGSHLIRQVDAQWYFMGVVTTEDIHRYRGTFTLEAIQNIASKITHLIIGAYDMEGYICWVKD